jgi:hypothetical protein
MALNVRMTGKCYDPRRKQSWPNQGTIPHLPGEMEDKHDYSIRIVGVQAGISNEHLQNMSIKHCRYTKSLCHALLTPKSL